MDSQPPLLSIGDIEHAVAGSIVYPPGGRLGPRIQQDIQLVMLYTGRMDVSIDGRWLNVSPGHVVMLKPGREETFAFSKTEQTWHRWIAVHLREMDAAARLALDELPECLPLSEEMNRLLDLMLNVQRFSSFEDPVVACLGLAALHLYPTESRTALLQREKHPAVYEVLTRIRERYMEDLSLSDLAAVAGLSSEHLVRLFRQHEQTTPIAYLWRYRIDRAVELLISTGLNVTEIAQRCGFKTSHHFARMVKQETGRTASDIRRLSWSGMRKS
ncbi:AraC family transcriptional regulator [Cohnella nanjingensis]|uniref:Helix-turn-helix transcriptional regulator n=1 Tax=Cohnella nanjingensis TaxID=1387779 RepID=A0A7X0VE75_9BACL|nr:AraC family transcriptional regulator [Cohnella nanjingensis]MBB6670705.1 helix-turn-helix transcriptional regulator [Cohnella nanjingensis]